MKINKQCTAGTPTRGNGTITDTPTGRGKTPPAATWVPKQERPTQAIIENNRKTELCRNWQKGTCTYGGRCAFAHGVNELKYRTLREMETAGRIPDASKYRCYPCMTWVATGSCPYASRCVFIHDPRAKGPKDAWLYAGCLAKSPSAYPSSDSSFFFPDMARDPDSLELPTHPSLYELDPRMSISDDISSRAVYNLWYSFVSIVSKNSAKDSEANKTTTFSSPLGRDSHVKNTHSYTASYDPRSSGKTGSLRYGLDQRNLHGAPKPNRVRPTVEVRRSPDNFSDSPSKLPVFVGLSRGVPTRPMTPPLSMAQLNGMLSGKNVANDYWSAWDDLLILETSSACDDALEDSFCFRKGSASYSATNMTDIDDDRSSSSSRYATCSTGNVSDSVFSDESFTGSSHRRHAVYPVAEMEPGGVRARDGGGGGFNTNFNCNFKGNFHVKENGAHLHGNIHDNGNGYGSNVERGLSSHREAHEERWPVPQNRHGFGCDMSRLL